MRKAREKINATQEQALTSKERYSLRLLEFEKFYLTVVLFSAAAVFVGIAVAVLFDLLIGAACSVAAAAVYVYFVCDEARKQLGIRYKNTCGHIVITKLICVYGDCLVLPSKFIYADVRVIGDGALDSEENNDLATLYLPSSIRRIGKDIFGEHTPLITVCFEGTREEWESIEKETDFSVCSILFECEYPHTDRVCTLSERESEVNK